MTKPKLEPVWFQWFFVPNTGRVTAISLNEINDFDIHIDDAGSAFRLGLTKLHGISRLDTP